MDDSSPPDRTLIDELLQGDQGALRQLMTRYDRLVRYVIFRASPSRFRRDPHWVESLASATWLGFTQSVQRRNTGCPTSVQAYLVRIARNQVTSELRRAGSERVQPESDKSNYIDKIAARVEEPAELISRLELLEVLRLCVSKLSAEDRALIGQLAAITERRWVDAGRALGLPESTLRSRWSRTLERLRRCLDLNRTEVLFAHKGSANDYC